jgi:hypothetical protein
MEQKLADQGAALADDKRDALQKSYQEKAIAFKRFQDDANRELETAQKKELSELERRVFPVINRSHKGLHHLLTSFSRLSMPTRPSIDRRSAEGSHDRAVPHKPADASAQPGCARPGPRRPYRKCKKGPRSAPAALNCRAGGRGRPLPSFSLADVGGGRRSGPGAAR